ncbi:hypothetical protein PCURB6_40960 [Paenibacillus curdlanolyticus]|nr:hypothetical protein PCURB6_40960 [Paenibacillus curdlanolyticus]
MLEIILQNFQESECDGILLIDDADCQFESPEQLEDERQRLAARITKSVVANSVLLYGILSGN